MPRHSKNHEFLSTLYEPSGAPNYSQFAKQCGKHPAQIHDRLKNGNVVTAKFLLSCLQHLFGWSVSPRMEIAAFPEIRDIPNSSGVYVIYDSGGNVLYVGKATDFRAEIRQACNRKIPVGIRLGPKLKKVNPKINDLAAYLSLYEIPSKRVRHNFESMLLRIIANQTHNSNIGTAT
ncbi:MAG: hypothetical protein H0U98_01895 [Alphaproteobacteria bacterium]|nr:hypothetical protein [Alphaproteobacteria bacterium]